MKTPGVYYGMPIDDYHSEKSISKTGLDDMARSPAHFHALHLNPNRPARVVKESHVAGNLLHCAVLEPEAFDQRYCVLPPDAPKRPTPAQWNAKESSESSEKAKAFWLKWNAENDSKTTISSFDRLQAQQMARSIVQLPEVFRGMSAGELLERGQSEVSAFWTDPKTGEACRCRPDSVVMLNARQALLMDVKGFGDVSAREFSRQCGRMAYYVQDAWYSDGFSQATGIEVVGFVFLVVEDQWPYAAASFQLGEQSRLEGFNEYRHLLDLYAQCKRADHWPGPSQRTTTIDLPAYFFDRPDEVIEFDGNPQS